MQTHYHGPILLYPISRYISKLNNSKTTNSNFDFDTFKEKLSAKQYLQCRKGSCSRLKIKKVVSQ